MEKAYVAIIKTTGHKFFFLATQDDEKRWNIQAFKTETDGIRSFESLYRSWRERGGTFVSSITINALSFQPSIVSMTLEEMQNLVSEKTVMSVRNISGSFEGIPLKSEAEKIWEAGEKPMAI